MDDLLSSRPQLIRNCRLSNTPEQGAMLLMPEGVIRLKGTGLAILEQCTGEKTLQDILEILQFQFAGISREQLVADVLPFLKGLREKRVLDFK